MSWITIFSGPAVTNESDDVWDDLIDDFSEDEKDNEEEGLFWIWNLLLLAPYCQEPKTEDFCETWRFFKFQQFQGKISWLTKPLQSGRMTWGRLIIGLTQLALGKV